MIPKITPRKHNLLTQSVDLDEVNCVDLWNTMERMHKSALDCNLATEQQDVQGT